MAHCLLLLYFLSFVLHTLYLSQVYIVNIYYSRTLMHAFLSVFLFYFSYLFFALEETKKQHTHTHICLSTSCQVYNFIFSSFYCSGDNDYRSFFLLCPHGTLLYITWTFLCLIPCCVVHYWLSLWRRTFFFGNYMVNVIARERNGRKGKNDMFRSFSFSVFTDNYFTGNNKHVHTSLCENAMHTDTISNSIPQLFIQQKLQKSIHSRPQSVLLYPNWPHLFSNEQTNDWMNGRWNVRTNGKNALNCI